MDEIDWTRQVAERVHPPHALCRLEQAQQRHREASGATPSLPGTHQQRRDKIEHELGPKRPGLSQAVDGCLVVRGRISRKRKSEKMRMKRARGLFPTPIKQSRHKLLAVSFQVLA